jgi:hypothetical protein
MRFSMRTMLVVFPWVACALMVLRTWNTESTHSPLPKYRLAEQVLANGRPAFVSDVMWSRLAWSFDRQPWWYEVQLVEEPERFQYWHESKIKPLSSEARP